MKETTRKAHVYHKENMIPEANHNAVQKDTERNTKGDQKETIRITGGSLKEITTISRRIPK